MDHPKGMIWIADTNVNFHRCREFETLLIQAIFTEPHRATVLAGSRTSYPPMGWAPYGECQNQHQNQWSELGERKVSLALFSQERESTKSQVLTRLDHQWTIFILIFGWDRPAWANSTTTLVILITVDAKLWFKFWFIVGSASRRASLQQAMKSPPPQSSSNVLWSTRWGKDSADPMPKLRNLISHMLSQDRKGWPSSSHLLEITLFLMKSEILGPFPGARVLGKEDR